jgi:hypothetical protein
MAAKELKLNTGKCLFTVISESTIPYILSAPPSINGDAIQYAPSLDYLGVTLDHKLVWSENSRRKAVKAKRAIGSILRLLRNRLPSRQLQQILVSKVMPIFLYGITVTYPRNKTDRIALERLGRYIARISTNNYTKPYGELLLCTDMDPVNRTVLHRRIQLAQRYSRGSRYLPPGTVRAFVQSNALRRRHHESAIMPVETTGLRYRDFALELSLAA